MMKRNEIDWFVLFVWAGLLFGVGAFWYIMLKLNVAAIVMLVNVVGVALIYVKLVKGRR